MIIFHVAMAWWQLLDNIVKLAYFLCGSLKILPFLPGCVMAAYMLCHSCVSCKSHSYYQMAYLHVLSQLLSDGLALSFIFSYLLHYYLCRHLNIIHWPKATTALTSTSLSWMTHSSPLVTGGICLCQIMHLMTQCSRTFQNTVMMKCYHSQTQHCCLSSSPWVPSWSLTSFAFFATASFLVAA